MAVRKYSEPIWKHEPAAFSEKGTQTVDTFVLDFPDRGGVCLKKTGEKPLYEMIQANLVNCDLQNVIESCVHSNQYAVCTQENLNTMIADFTGVTNLGDLYAGTKRMENTWKDLPLEVRESFDGDIKKFIRGIGTSDFNEKVATGFDNFYKSMNKNTITEVVPPVSEAAQTVPEVNASVTESASASSGVSVDLKG